MTLISRDPFSRYELHREIVRTSETCKWCGSNHKHRLFQYTSKSDGGTSSPIPGLFCSKSCMDAYHSR